MMSKSRISFSRMFFVVGLLASVAVLPACNVTTPTEVTARDIEVEKAVKTTTFRAHDMTSGDAAKVAQDYRSKGLGAVSVMVTYPPGGTAEAAARTQAEAIKEMLQREGLRNIETDTIPVTVTADAGQAILSYSAYTAHAPKDCYAMPGTFGTESGIDGEKYPFGCGLKTARAMQVANPADLLGRSGVGASTSRREGTIIEPGMAGEPNEPLEGLNSSNISE